MKIYLIVLKVVACLACWCRGKTFPSPRKYCLTTLMTFKIPNITWHVGQSFNLCVDLQRPGWLYALGIPPWADVRLWTPRARATDLGQTQTCVRGPGGLPACHGAESTRKEPRPEEKKMPKGQKNTHIIYIYTGWVGVVWQRHSKAWRALRELDNQGTYRFFFFFRGGGRRNWRPS